MNCNPTITAEEFKTIHNALWELDGIKTQLEDVLHKDLYIKLACVAGDIRRGLASAYEQDSQAFERKGDHYEKVRIELGLSTTWSIYEVDDLNERHPFVGATTVLYKDHWGDKDAVRIPINGLTWAALYMAANAAIRDSGDTHHCYIERFRPTKDDASILVLTTGS
jgi:hypothetical protein